MTEHKHDFSVLMGMDKLCTKCSMTENEMKGILSEKNNHHNQPQINCDGCRNLWLSGIRNGESNENARMLDELVNTLNTTCEDDEEEHNFNKRLECVECGFDIMVEIASLRLKGDEKK